MDELLQIKDLKIKYHSYGATIEAVNGISLTVSKSETLGIVGETGAGKTTTALSIMRLLPKKVSEVTDGSIIFEGKNLLELPERDMRMIRGSKIAMIFQDPMTSLNPIQTVGQQIAEVIALHQDIPKAEIDKKVDELMETVGLPKSRKKEYPHQYSGGMKQRVVIAIALACNPLLLIADEPTSALDVTIQAQILNMIRELRNKFETALVLITHDLGIVVEMCDKIAIMYAGEIVEMGTVEQLLSNPSHPYTVGLFNCIPQMEGIRRRLTPIRGLMPDPTNLPAGCNFYPRCNLAKPECQENNPPYHDLDGHLVKCFCAFASGEVEHG